MRYFNNREPFGHAEKTRLINSMSDDDASEYYRPTRDIHPNAQLPDDPETMVWRYMDWWKFEALVRNRALYLRRLDLVQDKFEGSYSAQQIMEMEQWLRDRGYEGQIVLVQREVE
jgi:hypothetical protein